MTYANEDGAMARTQRLAAELEARRVAASNAVRDFEHTLATSDDADAVIRAKEAAQGAKARLAAIQEAQLDIRNQADAAKYGVDFKPGPGASGRLEAAKRFTKKGGTR